MGWLAPGFLLGALTIAVPVWLHLLKRSASQPRQFSSLMLFEPQTRSTTRRRRIDHWLLLLLRIAVLLLIAAAFAEPYVRGHLPGAAPEKLLVLAVDDSFSMRAGTRMEDARRAALAVVAAKPRDTRAQVVALGSQAEPGESRRYEPDPDYVANYSYRQKPRTPYGTSTGTPRGSSGYGKPAPRAAKSKDPLVGTRVRHSKYGVGTIIGVEGEGEERNLTVSFQDYGAKKLKETYANLQLA